MLLLDKNYFEVLNLPQSFAVDEGRLEEHYRDLLAVVHPDRFVTSSPEQRRLAMQAATLANEAWRSLRDPVDRAAYLCRLNGHPVDVSARSAIPPEFLFTQMEWREALETAHDSRDRAAVLALQIEVQQVRQQLLEQIARLIDEEANFQEAASCVNRLMYVNRFAEQLDDELDASS
jgi:molecular chaperone HscB